MVLAGRAGSGKTYVIQDVSRHIDLEALANHRGSAFGGLGPQPPPIAFENALAAACLSITGDAPVVLEDESRTIGRLAIPPALYGAMQFAPIVLLEVDQPTRIDHILDEYVERAEHPRDALLAALDRIRRRLGGLRHQQIQELMNEAFLQRDGQRARNGHREWIRLLLDGYYDPMYDYQVSQKDARIVHRGDAESVKRFLLDATGS